MSVAERLIHLSMLLDTLLLYDHIYVLAAELPPDADNLNLRRILLDQGILRTIDTRHTAKLVATELGQFLMCARKSMPFHSRVGGEYVADVVRLIFGATATDLIDTTIGFKVRNEKEVL